MYIKWRLHISVLPLVFCASVVIFAATWSLDFLSVFPIPPLICCLICLIFWFLAVKIENILRLVFAFIAGIFAIWPFCAQISAETETLSRYIGKEATISGILSSDVQYKKDNWRLGISDLTINNNIKCSSSQVFVMLSRDPGAAERSDRVTFKGVISKAFGSYAASIYRPKIISIKKPDPPDFATIARRGIAKILNERINSAPESSLALGYLLGDKSEMADDFVQQLRIVGLSHIVVASGFHLGVLMMAARKYLGKVSKLISVIGSLILMLVFLALTGFSPSLARAGLITTFSLVFGYVGRKIHPLRSILYAAAISLIIEPRYFLSLAWQLSFLSFIGITVVAPVLISFFYGSKTPSFISASIIQSLSAQMLCLPITLMNFGSVSIIGVLANLLISPSIALVIILSIVVIITTTIPLVSSFLAIILKSILYAHLWTIDVLSKIPWATIELSANVSILILIPIILLVVYLIALAIGFKFRPTPLLEKSQKDGKIYAC